MSGFLQALLLVQAEVASELVSGSSTVVGVQIPLFGFDGDVSRSRLKMAQPSKWPDFEVLKLLNPGFLWHLLWISHP